MSTPKIIIERFTALSEFTAKGFMYNLNYLPDTVLGGIVLFALLLQSAPLGALGVSLFSLELVHAGLAAGLAESIPGLKEATKDVARCSGHFPGISYERATATLLGEGTLKTLSVGFPSYYMMFFGALFGYMLAMANTYEQELEGMPQKRAAVYAGVVIMGLLTFLFLLFRLFTACDTLISILIGAVAGLMYGYGIEMIIAAVSGRTMTNLMNVPLIRDRAADGKPIYVCKKE